MQPLPPDYWPALAARAVRAAEWRWLPGMVTMEGLIIVAVGDALHVRGHTTRGYRDSPIGSDLPGLNDDETCNRVRELVREARSDPRFKVRLTFSSPGEVTARTSAWTWGSHQFPTKGEALVAALETAVVRVGAPRS